MNRSPGVCVNWGNGRTHDINMIPYAPDVSYIQVQAAIEEMVDVGLITINPPYRGARKDSLVMEFTEKAIDIFMDTARAFNEKKSKVNRKKFPFAEIMEDVIANGPTAGWWKGEGFEDEDTEINEKKSRLVIKTIEQLSAEGLLEYSTPTFTPLWSFSITENLIDAFGKEIQKCVDNHRRES